jgi:hypothetical protein
MTSEAKDSIILRLEGARAQRGVALSDFETFIDSFIGALRDFDRDRRGVPTRKSGHPEARAEAVTAFRLVDFRQGSGIATIEPESATAEDDTDPLVDTEPIQMSNLQALLGCVEREEPLPESVTTALEKAIRSAGDDGSLSVEVSRPRLQTAPCHAVMIDLGRIERIRSSRQLPPPRLVTSISGRLHQVDFEPDRLAIRASDGVDWICTFSHELEQKVEELVNRLVWARGSGVQQSPRRGTMTLTAIDAIELGTQTSLFSGEPVPSADLAAAQGITEPQGLEAIGASEWTDADDAYLAALTNG